MLYSRYETEISRANLSTVAANVPSPLCILGGWAVFLLTNENFKKQHGNEYHGSKDIDLGFYFNEQEDEKSLKKSLFNKSITALKQIGFNPQSFRMVQIYHSETMNPLTEDESKRIPSYNLFYLYVDLLVNRIPERMYDVLRIRPASEPMITEIFEKQLYRTTAAFGVDILLPNPEVLLATKLKWVLERTKDHKKIKDIADIYALIWYTDTDISQLKKSVASLISQDSIDKIISSFTQTELKSVSNAIGVDVERIKSVLNSFISEPALNIMSSQDRADEKKWIIPLGVSFGTLNIILASIYQKQGDQKIISLDDIVKTSGITRRLVAENLRFFQYINLIKGSSKLGFQLTDLGTQFSKSLMQKNNEEIKNVIKIIISDTYLSDLVDYIHVHKETVSLSQLYLYIKTESRAPDGKMPGNMHSKSFSGARALLNMLNAAELLPQNVSKELMGNSRSIDNSRAKSKQPTSSKKSKQPTSSKKSKQPTSSKKSKQPTSQSLPNFVENNTTFPVGVHGTIILKDIGHINIKDSTTLDIARQCLDLLEKNIRESTSESL